MFSIKSNIPDNTINASDAISNARVQVRPQSVAPIDENLLAPHSDQAPAREDSSIRAIGVVKFS